ncbi:MAG: cytochrome oxidase [Tardiphaga sp.]|jgi:cytochrome o ubiquinol oxidase operon protein cyoD|uniref:cytochrome o ubiquinol oxidase subunit IV n=1 Tax=Tardiphaga sp. TaxID=1926292 RepID=UPI002601C6FD|nr:cytochrome o ubiquinol oxidase subunit IV [Tardiphaga sp.]MDB5505179.1 cytochrome oxidase [Tardiphaga sp.]
MTAHAEPHADSRHGDSHHHDDGAAHGTRRDYMIGFGLSVLLTAIPFWLVMSGTIQSKQVTAFLVMGFALAQIVVHMVYFLHMNSKSEGGWTVMAMIFTVVIIVITLSGSLWVMYHLNTNMMPMMTPEAMKNMP